MVRESMYCPHCQRHTQLTKGSTEDIDTSLFDEGLIDGEIPSSFGVYTKSGRWWIGVCNFCEKCVLVHEKKHKSRQSNKIIWYRDRIYPDPLPKPLDERLPSFIKKELNEAQKCLSVGSYRATAVLCRRILQVIFMEKGVKKKDLVDQIDELLEKGIITKDIQLWAHSVRWVGNSAAHPSKSSGEAEVLEEDAKDIFDLVEKISYILYTAKSIVEKKKEKFRKKR